MNDADRAEWIDNDEGLYLWWKSSLLSKKAFIRKNRAELTAAINAVLTSTQPTHFLAYGPTARY